MKKIYTRCHSIEEADALGRFIVGEKGYEGVQNDSYRYCRLSIEIAFKRNARHRREYVYIGVNGGQLVVDYCKRGMIREGTMKFIEKERIFRKLLSTN